MQPTAIGITAAVWGTIVQVVEGAPVSTIAAVVAGLGLVTALLGLVTKVGTAVKQSLDAGARREERAIEAIEELARLTREVSLRAEYRERLQEREFGWLREKHEEGRREFVEAVADRAVSKLEPALRRATESD